MNRPLNHHARRWGGLRDWWMKARNAWSHPVRAAGFVAALSSVAAISVLGSFSSDLRAQLLYMPILLATWALGAFGALVLGASAAISAPLMNHLGMMGFAQPLMYLFFAGGCALLIRDTSEAEWRRTQAKRPWSAHLEEPLEGRERVLESLARTVEVRDHHTQGHCRRVAKNAVVLGRALSLTDEDLDVLYWSALLHDLGKIAVPDYILLKSGRLSDEEFSEIRRHAAYGADLLTSVSTSFRPIADVVRAHHERWDGLGYPLGSRGSEIPRLARIIAVIDVFEALTSERPYRRPLPADQALRYITKGAGSQFDPAVVAKFEELVGQGVVDWAVDPELSTIEELPAYTRVLHATS